MEQWNIAKKNRGKKSSLDVFFFVFRCWQIELESLRRMYIVLLAISGFCFIREKN